MNVLWSRDQATVREVHDSLSDARELAYTTIMTVMTRLHSRGLLEREKDGRAFVYKASSSQREVARSFVRRVVDRLMGGRPSALVNALLEEEEISDEELSRIRAMIDAYDEEER